VNREIIARRILPLIGIGIVSLSQVRHQDPVDVYVNLMSILGNAGPNDPAREKRFLNLPVFFPRLARSVPWVANRPAGWRINRIAAGEGSLKNQGKLELHRCSRIRIWRQTKIASRMVDPSP
jgi:hypothetical protein